MALTYTQGSHREWAASVLEDWHEFQAGLLKGNLSEDEQEGIKSGVLRTGELVRKLQSRKILASDEWDDVLMYVWQERSK